MPLLYKRMNSKNMTLKSIIYSVFIVFVKETLVPLVDDNVILIRYDSGGRLL